MEVIANTKELLQFSVQSEVYSEAILFKSLYWLTSRAGFEVSKPAAETFLISVKPLGENFPNEEREDILARIRTNLVDFKVRDMVNQETMLVRSMIIAKAFAHGELPAHQESHSPGPNTTKPPYDR